MEHEPRHKADFADIAVLCPDISAVYEYLARGRSQQTVEVLYQRGFPAPGMSYYADELPFFDAYAHVVNGGRFKRRSDAVFVGELLHLRDVGYLVVFRRRGCGSRLFVSPVRQLQQSIRAFRLVEHVERHVYAVLPQSVHKVGDLRDIERVSFEFIDTDEYLLRRAVHYYLSLVHYHNAVGLHSLVHIVRYQYHRDALRV